MTRVIKVGGRPQSDPSLAERVAKSWNAHRDATILVHGGGDEVSRLQSALGGEAKFVGGRRVTNETDLEIIRMGLSGSANKRLVAALQNAGAQAIGLSGEDGALVTAKPIDPDTLGHVGAPAHVNVQLLWLLMDAGYLPVISPVSRNCTATLGPVLNVNGDDAAAAIAVAVEAAELLLVSDVEGVKRDGTPISRVTVDEARALVTDGVAVGGMAAKLEAAIRAVEGGVKQVRISDLAAIDDLDRGTVVVRNNGGLS